MKQLSKLNFILKRNKLARKNTSPAFRSNAAPTHKGNASSSITTAIRARLLTSLPRVNFVQMFCINNISRPMGFNPLKNQAAIHLIILGFLFTFLLTACENDMNEVNRLTKNNHPQFDYADEIEILYSEDGMVKAKINAPELVKNSTGKPFTEFPKGIRVEILNTAKKPVTVMTANYGKRFDRSEETIVQNDVIVTNKNGDKLETEELTRNDKTGELKTDAFVKITTATEVIYGMGLKANEDFSVYRIDSVYGDININQNSFLPNNF